MLIQNIITEIKKMVKNNKSEKIKAKIEKKAKNKKTERALFCA